ncbi:Molybdopterin binding protein [Caenispirillum salinarum AK4]|uniref:Molybdopterin binding protein n=1 Tax=Caenispirillum salinarum AK4 TaxID=1238182 RepID=K9GSG9_9PROT|nr:molybdopterin-binding protein [Caenispirillum salinarum]EKV27659.1 Molybdopterin binding protein [Caenispirillum salinarum AK4]
MTDATSASPTAPADPSAGEDGAVVTAALLVIGNEVLSGRTRDANVQVFAKTLGARGVRLKEVRMVADDKAAIIDAVNALRAANDYVFTTGGIGPTHDDITTDCVAEAFGRAVELNAEAERRLRHHYGSETINDARLRMARIPAGAELVDNPVSHAPGFRLGNVFVMAGVPRIAQAMLDTVKDGLRGGAPVHSRAVTAYIREGDIAEPLGAIQERFPAVEIGSYPFVRGERLGTSVVARCTDATLAEAVVADVANAMRAAGADPNDAEGFDPQSGAVAAFHDGDES